VDRQEQHEQAMALYAQAMGIVDPLRIRAWVEAELTTSQLRLLFLLRQDPGASLGTLAAHLRVSAPTVSGIVDRLARQELIRREDDSTDRRLVRHWLTERANSLTADLEREGRALMDSILGRLTAEELGTLIAGLAFLTASAEDASGAAAAAGSP
jgi:DNA-binding MarR family transcriptional regulator